MNSCSFTYLMLYLLVGYKFSLQVGSICVTVFNLSVSV